jgi:hypothetical protein
MEEDGDATKAFNGTDVQTLGRSVWCRRYQIVQQFFHHSFVSWCRFRSGVVAGASETLA